MTKSATKCQMDFACVTVQGLSDDFFEEVKLQHYDSDIADGHQASSDLRELRRLSVPNGFAPCSQSPSSSCSIYAPPTMTTVMPPLPQQLLQQRPPFDGVEGGIMQHSKTDVSGKSKIQNKKFHFQLNAEDAPVLRSMSEPTSVSQQRQSKEETRKLLLGLQQLQQHRQDEPIHSFVQPQPQAPQVQFQSQYQPHARPTPTPNASVIQSHVPSSTFQQDGPVSRQLGQPLKKEQPSQKQRLLLPAEAFCGKASIYDCLDRACEAERAERARLTPTHQGPQTPTTVARTPTMSPTSDRSRENSFTGDVDLELLEAAVQLGASLRAQGVSTLLIKNVPSELTQPQVAAEMERSGFGTSYDFLHVPVDTSTYLGKGYAIINFQLPEALELFVAAWHMSNPFTGYGFSQQVLVKRAPLQGARANARALGPKTFPSPILPFRNDATPTGRAVIAKPPGVFRGISDDGLVSGDVSPSFSQFSAPMEQVQGGVPFRLPPGLTLE